MSSSQGRFAPFCFQKSEVLTAFFLSSSQYRRRCHVAADGGGECVTVVTSPQVASTYRVK